MAPAGGIEVMLLLIGVSGAIFALVALVLRDRVGTVSAWAIAGFCWSLVVIAVVTLVPTEADVGIVSAEGRMTSCSTDIGGPAPDGFWIFAGGQRLLNTVLFIPAAPCWCWGRPAGGSAGCWCRWDWPAWRRTPSSSSSPSSSSPASTAPAT